MTDVLTSRVDVEQVRLWERLGRPPGVTFHAAVVIAVLATWGAASWPGFWLPLLLPLEAAWLARGSLAGAPRPCDLLAWRDFRWLGAPAIVLVGAVASSPGCP